MTTPSLFLRDQHPSSAFALNLKRQNGSIEIVLLFSLVILSGLLILVALTWTHQLKQTRNQFKQLICFKKYAYSLQEMSGFVEKINGLILKGEITSTVLMFVTPGIKLSWIKIKKILQLTQNLRYLHHYLQMGKLLQQGCSPFVVSTVTPYQLRGTGLMRGTLGAAKSLKRSHQQITKIHQTTFKINWLLSPHGKLIWRIQ